MFICKYRFKFFKSFDNFLIILYVSAESILRGPAGAIGDQPGEGHESRSSK